MYFFFFLLSIKIELSSYKHLKNSDYLLCRTFLSKHTFKFSLKNRLCNFMSFHLRKNSFHSTMTLSVEKKFLYFLKWNI